MDVCTKPLWALQSPYGEGFCKAPYTEGAFTHIHTHISVFFPTDMGVLHKAHVEKGFSKALRGFAKAL